MASAFRDSLAFWDRLGIFDVVVPFLFVFVVVFAILEKTKLFGKEEIDGKSYTRKNLNAFTAILIAFMVVASSKLVAIITDVSSRVVIALLLGIFFLLLVGAFMKEGEGVFLEGIWKNIFMVIMFITVIGIFLWAIETEDGTPWLEWAWDEVTDNWSSEGVASVILLIIMIGFIAFIVREPKKAAEKKE